MPIRNALFSLLALFLCTSVRAQVTLSGYLLSEHDSETLSYGTVYAQNNGLGVTADSSGYFVLEGLTSGPEILNFTHIGCDGETREITLARDTQITVYLHHHDNYVETVTVAAQAFKKHGAEQDNRATADLADGLEQLTGVSTLRTGTAAAKPVYDGLFGNRLSIQNNGIAQSGQQWGNDHSPEIDPWVAAYVRVVEGVEALKYAGPTAGATVLIEPAPLRETEDFSGKAAYTFQSNGFGNVANARVSNGGKTAYRLSLTGKLRGDQRTPAYYLRNTGRREGDAALQLARFHSERWTSRVYLSTFNAEIGVLRGAHIGNLTDLEEAIGRAVPFFTEDTFSARLSSPRQRVSHHFVKAETEFRPNEDNRMSLKYGGQLNDRKEFDVRRGGREDVPALSLLQTSHFVEGTWHRELGPGQHLDASVQYDNTANRNQPETGILPLLPDYNSHRASGYLAFHRERGRFQFHGGLRFDRQFFEAITISREVPRPPDPIERFEHTYNSVGASAESRWQITDAVSLRGGLTYRERAPQINELYSNGLHQGVSGIEEGSRDLGMEKSLKISASTLISGPRLGVSATVFAQPINDFIFLEPQEILRQTIRGAFPVFRYRSADALLYGINVQGYWQVRADLKVSGALSQVRGEDRRSKEGLVFIPPTNFRAGLSYEPGDRWTGLSLGAGFYHSFEQRNVDAELDILPPPEGYSLVDLSVGYAWKLINKNILTFRVAGENVLNTTYRDYLDRQRYFADAPGLNLTVGVNYAW
ncbi:TonB-dependent receptor [Neolewinella antarctica]|uniref:Iron complex outermembrane receptor protein n=1 Tax=Neolewinella antarctica TaxID=442734 RepID=A0ABX0XAT0_9BACT|nr:TonB-dependent receptor [Neolewinella antarctica]NJC26317.1 iron complex outermembrane receptor protein [Neolewinella antarctica]